MMMIAMVRVAISHHYKIIHTSTTSITGNSNDSHSFDFHGEILVMIAVWVVDSSGNYLLLWFFLKQASGHKIVRNAYLKFLLVVC